MHSLTMHIVYWWAKRRVFSPFKFVATGLNQPGSYIRFKLPERDVG